MDLIIFYPGSAINPSHPKAKMQRHATTHVGQKESIHQECGLHSRHVVHEYFPSNDTFGTNVVFPCGLQERVHPKLEALEVPGGQEVMDIDQEEVLEEPIKSKKHKKPVQGIMFVSHESPNQPDT